MNEGWAFSSDLDRGHDPDKNECMSEHAPRPTRRISAMNVFLTVLLLVLIGAVVTTGYLYYRTRQELKYLSSPEGQEALSKKEVDETITQLKKLVILPEEEPVLATIVNAEFLATQSAFYKGAENGDKLVVYPQAQRAFVYSPTRNILVNAGPLIVEQGANQQGVSEQVSEEDRIRVDVRNGTTQTGVATQLGNALRDRGYTVGAVAEASRKDFEQTIVVDLSNGRSASVLKLAQLLGAEVVQALPQGEQSSSAEALVILGAR